MGWTRPIRRALRLRHRPDVETLEVRTLLSTQPIPAGSPTLTSSGATDFSTIVGAAQARSTYGVDGTGMTVAVIDTGINYNNTAFGGGGFGPGHKVVAGYDFADNSPNPTAIEQHGTAVAGLIASDAPSDPGIAPGADIADLRVFNNSDVSSFNAVATALQWVITNHSQYNITAVNISLSDGGNYQRNWFAQDGSVGQQVTTLIGQLDALNIPVITATGNSFTGQQGQAFPSIVPDTISVTATDASNQIVSDAQRLGTAEGLNYATDLAAPGQGLTAPVDGNNFATVDGTSFAAPLVTGAVVLLQQIYEQRFGTLPTVSDLDNWLQAGADPINDPTTGITIGRLDIPKAAALIPGAPSPSPAASSNPGTTANPTPQPPVTPVTIPITSTTAPQTTTAPTSTPIPTQTSPTPPPANSPPPQTTTPPTTTTPTSTVTVVFNGQVQTGSTSQPSSSISALLSLFSNIFSAANGSSGGASNSTSNVKTVSIGGVSTSPNTSPHPAGKILLNTEHPGVVRAHWRSHHS